MDEPIGDIVVCYSVRNVLQIHRLSGYADVGQDPAGDWVSESVVLVDEVGEVEVQGKPVAMGVRDDDRSAS